MLNVAKGRRPIFSNIAKRRIHFVKGQAFLLVRPLAPFENAFGLTVPKATPSETTSSESALFVQVAVLGTGANFLITLIWTLLACKPLCSSLCLVRSRSSASRFLVASVLS